MATTESRTEDVRWDLSDLCGSADEGRAGWTSLVEQAGAFAARYRGTIASLDAAGLRALLDESDELAQDLSRLQVYTFLRRSMDATDVEANDLTTIGRDRGADIENDLLFLGLEWIALDDDAAEALLTSKELAPYAHKLRVEREEKPYVLSEPEEQALNARRPVVSSWQALHDRQVSTLEIPFDSGDGVRPHTVSELLSCLYRNDRDVRLKAVQTLFEGLEPRTDVLAACYDALVGDRLTVDRLRGFKNPMQPTNMGNELDDETVEAMLTATEESYGIGRKWFDAKARLLGLDNLELADQYAPIGEARAFSWPEAVEVVETSFGRFSPKLSEIFRGCLDAGHVDAYPRGAKAPGAYCTAVSKQILPYVLMNYTDRLRDVSTLAHEFGHATHNVLALERQTWRSHRCGIPMAEVPSTFAQALADDYLLENEADAGTRASLAADRLENAFAAIYRQTVLARFEQRAYGVRGEGPRARRRAPERALGRGERALLRRLARDAGGLRVRLVVHPALHPRSLLHLRVLVRAARRAAALPPLSRGSRGVRPEVPRAAGRGRLRIAGRPRRAVRPRPPLDRHVARGVRGARRDARRGRDALAGAISRHDTRHDPAQASVGAVLDVLLPQRCLVCGAAGPQLCAGCRAALPVLGPPLCERCGAPTAWPVRRCSECAGRRLAFATARAAVAYDESVRLLVAGLEGARACAGSPTRPPRSSPSGCAAPRRRGAHVRPARTATAASSAATTRRSGSPPRLAAAWSLPCEPLLAALGALPAPARPLAAGAAPERRGRLPAAARVPGARVVLVDDVYTSGATASAAASARAAGARRVDVVTFARALRGVSPVG